jgi:hypothetical protein
MTIDLAGLPDRITLPTGERREYPLPSYAGSGNAWTTEPVEGEEVARVTIALRELPPEPTGPADGTAEPPTTGYAPEVAVVDGLAPGEARWRLVLARSFGPREVAATHLLRVTVVDMPRRPAAGALPKAGKGDAG